jgi:hypothetical protein
MFLNIFCTPSLSFRTPLIFFRKSVLLWLPVNTPMQHANPKPQGLKPIISRPIYLVVQAMTRRRRLTGPGLLAGRRPPGPGWPPPPVSPPVHPARPALPPPALVSNHHVESWSFQLGAATSSWKRKPSEPHLGLGTMLPAPPRPPSLIKDSSSGSITVTGKQ